MGVFFLELLLYYKLSLESSYLYIIHQILSQHILVFSFLLEKSSMDGVYVIFILVEHHLSFFFYFYILQELYFMVHTYNPNTWFSGILLLFFLMAIAFMGYVLPFGQMSFWGATVITNLLSPFPSLVEWICGGHCVHCPTLKRFFLFHFIFPFLLCGFLFLHLFYLHFLSSNNPLRNSTNNKIPFFPFIFLKDFFGLILILCLYLLQTHFHISSLSHPDNALEACALLTPLHIVPEWYFLCQYAMLKAVPNKNAGFIVLLTSILILFFFGEIRNLTTFTRLMDCNNGFSLSFFFGLFLS